MERVATDITLVCELRSELPQVTSLHKEERQLARRLRIARRIKKLGRRDSVETKAPDVEEEVERSLLEQKLEESERVLGKLILQEHDDVNTVRVTAVTREVDRRDVEGCDRENVMDQLEEEVALAQQMFDQVANKWLRILKSDDPLHVHDALSEQMEKCSELVTQKNSVIAMLKEDVRRMQRQSSDDQLKQNADIKNLTVRIEKQVMNMKKACREALRAIEEIIIVERKLLTEANYKKWSELYNSRECEERKQSTRKLVQKDKFYKDFYEQNILFLEKYRKMRIYLENLEADLLQYIEDVKASIIMNREKLDYNYQILRKREDENTILRSQQKRRINKLQDVIDALRKQNREYDEKTKADMIRLSAEVKKLRKCVAEIGNKAKSLSKINELKHSQVWDLNVDDADKLLHRIFSIDEILHRQHLGLEVDRPEHKLLTKMELPSYREAMEKLHKKKIVGGLGGGDGLLTKNKSSIGKVLAETNVDLSRSLGYDSLMNQVLVQLVDEAGFLIEEKLQAVLEPYVGEQRDLVKVDAVFAALGVKNSKDVDLMFKYFFAYSRCDVCGNAEGSEKHSDRTLSVLDVSMDDSSASKSCHFRYSILMQAVNEPDEVINEVVHKLIGTVGQTDSVCCMELTESLISMTSSSNLLVKSEQMSAISKSEMDFAYLLGRQAATDRLTCVNGHPLVINRNYVIKALKEFTTDLYARNKSEMTLTTAKQQKDYPTISRLVTEKDMVLFWTKYRNIFSHSKDRLWDGLLLGLTKYYDILRDRKRQSIDVTCLRKKNREFKEILREYDASLALRPPCAQQRLFPLTPQIISCTKL